MRHGSQKEIETKRCQIERELKDHLRETKSDFTVEDIKKRIYEEHESKDFTNLIMLFDTGQGAVELNAILETLSEAWNYFPHKSLGGLSPAEKISGMPR